MTEAPAGDCRNVDLGRDRVRALFDAALKAVDPARAVAAALDFRAGSMHHRRNTGPCAIRAFTSWLLARRRFP